MVYAEFSEVYGWFGTCLVLVGVVWRWFRVGFRLYNDIVQVCLGSVWGWFKGGFEVGVFLV